VGGVVFIPRYRWLSGLKSLWLVNCRLGGLQGLACGFGFINHANHRSTGQVRLKECDAGMGPHYVVHNYSARRAGEQTPQLFAKFPYFLPPFMFIYKYMFHTYGGSRGAGHS